MSREAAVEVVSTVAVEKILEGIQKDHAVIARFLEVLSSGLDAARPLDPARIVGVVDGFIEGQHHAIEEEILFAPSASDRQRNLLARHVGHVHEDGRRHIEGMLWAARSSEKGAAAAFGWNAAAFVTFMYEHIDLEENELMPRVREEGGIRSVNARSLRLLRRWEDERRKAARLTDTLEGGPS